MTAHRRRSDSQREVLDEHGRPIRERIRRRRRELELTASEVARRAGISPAYMTRIEKGDKVPGEEVAVALARALGDDPELYLAWIHGRYFSDPEGTLEGLRRISYREGPPSDWTRLRMEREKEERRVEKLTEKRRRLESEIERRKEELATAGAPAETRSSPERVPAALRRARLGSLEARKRLAVQEHCTAAFDEARSFGEALMLASDEAVQPHPGPVRVPVFEHGVDPGTRPERSKDVVGWLWFDPSLLPERTARVFAYRATGTGDPGGPGDPGRSDLVLLGRQVRTPPDPEKYYAVRTPRSEERAGREGAGPVCVTRVRLKDDSLIVFPRGTSTDVEIVDLGPGRDPSRFLVGEVLAIVRRGPGQG